MGLGENYDIKTFKNSRFLEVLIGISMIIFVWQLLGHDDPGHMEDAEAMQAFMEVIDLYAIHVFEIIAGLIGIVKSKKGSLLTVLLGVILFLMNLVEFLCILQTS